MGPVPNGESRPPGDPSPAGVQSSMPLDRGRPATHTLVGYLQVQPRRRGPVAAIL